jgi:hypothetical protein
LDLHPIVFPSSELLLFLSFADTHHQLQRPHPVRLIKRNQGTPWRKRGIERDRGSLFLC